MMSHYVHALLIDRKGFQKIMVVKFDPLIKIADHEPMSSVSPGEVVEASDVKTIKVRDFYFEGWLDKLYEEIGIWREK